jgi:ribonuclease PH
MSLMRPDNRPTDVLRPIAFQRNFTKFAQGSVLSCFGETKVLCTATVEEKVPGFLAKSGKGWVTAEYAMLPGSTNGRVPRNHISRGRAQEISRLIGRSLRCVVDLSALGERQITIDCDVLQADGGTRTAAITGSYIALHDACSYLVSEDLLEQRPLLNQCAAVSVGIVDGEARLDLCYLEDSAADVDMNIVMDEADQYIEVQGAAEGESFSRTLMDSMLNLAELGCKQLFEAQRKALASE